MRKLCSFIFLITLISFHANAQVPDTLKIQDPADFYYNPGDTLHIYLEKGDLDSVEVVFGKSGQKLFKYDRAANYIQFIPGNNKLEHLVYVMRNQDTVNSINFYPVTQPQLRTGFARYNAKKIMDESSYFEIRIDSSASEKVLKINGRKIVFENKTENLFYQYSYKPGQTSSVYKKIEIGADTLIIKDRIHFPFHRLLINARVLIIEYEGILPAIDITPIKVTRKIPVEMYAKGEDGKHSDTLFVFFDELICKDNTSRKLFAANGGDGQDAPLGKNGINYPALVAVNQTVKVAKTEGDGHCKNNTQLQTTPDNRANSLARIDVVLTQKLKGGSPLHGSDWEANCVWRGGNNNYSTVFSDINIKKAMPIGGGLPGEPGNAGVIISTAGIQAQSSIQGGKAGRLDSIRTSGKITGPEKIWMLSVLHRIGISNRGQAVVNVNDYKYEQLSYPKDSVFIPRTPQNTDGRDGMVMARPGKNWFNLDYIKFIVDYANDLFRFGNINEAEKIAGYYKKQFFDDADIRLAYTNNIVFAELDATVNNMMGKMAANVDFYGNVYGFVPGLDIVATSAVYGESIKRLTKAYAACIYLEKHFEAGTYQYNEAINQIDNYLSSNLNFEQDLQDIELVHIPLVEDKIDTTIAFLTGVTSRIKQLEKQFTEKAKSKVRARERREKNKSFFKSVAALAKVVPVGQPYLGVGASVMENLLYKEDGEGLMDQLSNVLDDYGKIKESKKAFDKFSQKVNYAFTTSPPGLPVYKKLYNNRDTLLKYIDPYMKKTTDLLAGLNTKKVTKESVATEIAKLKDRHPEYNTLIDSVEKLTELNKELMDALLTLQTKLVDIQKAIAYNSKMIDAVKAGLSTTNLPEKDRINSLAILRKDIFDKLNYYQYFYAKAYEYFTLKQYTGYEKTFYWLKGDKLKNYDDYGKLVSEVTDLYLADASDAALGAFELLNSQMGTVGVKTSMSMRLALKDVQKLNNGEPVNINFFRDPKYNLLRNEMEKNEDLLVEKIRLDLVYDPQSRADFKSETFAISKISVIHKGSSRRYKNGTQYDFFHVSSGDIPFYQWVFDMSFVTNELTAREVDDTYLGLINILTSGKLSLRKVVSFDSDFEFTKADLHPESKRVKLDSVKITFDFILIPRGNSYSVHLYDNFDEPSRVPFSIVSNEKVYKGNGFIYTSFKKDEEIALFTPSSWKEKTFSHWLVDGKVSSAGNILPLKMVEKFYSISPVYK